MKNINLVSLFKSEIWLKFSRICIKFYLPKNTYINIYIYTAFLKMHLAVPACCAGTYTENFSKKHRALHAFIDFKYPIQIYRFKSDNFKTGFIFQI